MMTADERIFVDTNVLFYALDGDAREKHDTARALLETIWRRRTGIISTQVLSEWTVNLRRKLGMDWGRIAGVVEPYLAWNVVEIEGKDTLQAIALADTHKLSYWDSLIIVAAAKAGAGVLLTEDLNHGQTILGVRVDNPFHGG